MKMTSISVVRALCLLFSSAHAANAAKPPPAYADVVITFGGQSFGFAGPLRYFDWSEAGGRVGLDLATLETPGYSPRRHIDGNELHAAENRWRLEAFLCRAPQTIAGTCAAESFATTEAGVHVQHVYLNCVDLEL